MGSLAGLHKMKWFEQNLCINCVCTHPTSVLTETFTIILQNSSNICLFKFWNDDAYFNVTVLFPSWQSSLFCFSVLNFFFMFPTFLAHGQFKKLWLFPFYYFCSFWLKRIGRREPLAFSKVYFTVIKLATAFSSNNSFIHSTNRPRALLLSRAGLHARDILMNKAWPHP